MDQTCKLILPQSDELLQETFFLQWRSFASWAPRHGLDSTEERPSHAYSLPMDSPHLARIPDR
jgi:hypothetical protein